jgi:O-antigen/teichoic acid export membrane protein
MKPADAADTEARRQERERRARWTSRSALAAQALSTAASLASVPLALSILGDERYGVWMTIATFISIASIADLGVGNGLTNMLARAHGVEDRQRAASAVTGAIAIVTAIALAATVAVTIAVRIAPWRTMLAAPEDIRTHELSATVVVCAGILVTSLWLGPFDRIYTGFQEGYLLNYFAMAASLSSLVGLGLAWWSSASMPWTVAALGVAPLVPRLGSAAYMLARRRPWLRPSVRSFDPDTTRQLFRLGLAFLVPQVAALGILGIDNIVIAQTLGPEAVSTYATVFRVPTILVTLCTMSLSPLWPAYAEAAARADHEWIRKTHRLALRRVIGLSVVSGVALCLFGRWAISTWTRGHVVPSISLLLADAVWMPVTLWCIVHATLLNGLDRVRGQAIYGLASAAINIGLSIVMARRFGSTGVSWATSIAALVPAVFSYVELRRYLQELNPDTRSRAASATTERSALDLPAQRGVE